VAIIPLLVGNRLLGLLVCDNKFTRERLTNLDLLAHFAARIAAMMENDRLSREARELAAMAGWQRGAHDEREQLHDKLHNLVGELQTRVRWDIEDAFEHFQHPEEIDSERAKDDLEDGLAVLDQITGPLKEVVEELRPPSFSERGLLDELRYHAPRLRAGQVTIEGPSRLAVPQNIQHELYLAGREGLTNAAKYSGAKSDPQIQIQLKVESLEDNRVRMSVNDNGEGFDVDQLGKNGRYGGLSRIKQRAEKAGGRCHIDSRPGTGTMLTVEFVSPDRG
jgi:signal transduction histidine kinase